ncbi:MAG: HAD hydrolase-like protein, partial [Candidatus Diapherotrites archaeon]|nr:HAD hydrolase-like protein [Candidatus Diapherotrites archaeon]
MPNPFRNARAVFFDIDGTLLNVFPAHIASYENAFHHVTGIRVTDPEFFKNRFQLGSDRRVWQDALRTYGRTPDEQTLDKLLTRRPSELAALSHKITPAHVLEGALLTLERLKAQKIRLFAVSGNTRLVGEQLLTNTGLRRF